MIENNNSLEVRLPKFVKYPRIPYLQECPKLIGHVGYIFEKIDGSLSQVRMTEEGILVGGSRSNYFIGSSKRPFWAKDFLRWMYSNDSLYNLPRNLIIFGEWLEPVTVEYYPENLRKFYFLDLALVEKDRPLFFDYDEAINYLNKWSIKGMKILPPIGKGFFTKEYLEELINSEKSFIGEEIEGFVLKNYRLGLFAKYLHPKYSEIREEEKTLERKYITKRRIEKAVRRLKDRGIKKPNLEELIKEIQEDIKNETGISFKINSIRGIVRSQNLFSC